MLQGFLAGATLLAAALVVYHHALFPLLLRQLAGRRPEPSAPPPGPLPPGPLPPGPLPPSPLPSVGILVPAHDEAAVIAAKIENLSRLDYPRDRLDILIVSDGSGDGTADLAAAAIRAAGPGFPARLVALDENVGKVAVLNRFLPTLGGEIAVLTDASAMVEPDAVRRLVAPFADPGVGVVSGGYRLVRPGSAGEAAYWRYQTRLKEAEARLGGAIGAHGAFYAVRRHLAAPLPADTINDDFVLPMEIVARGHRALYRPDAMATELECADAATDRRRRRRIAAGNLQQAIRLRRLLHPRHGWTAFVFGSGKVLRSVMPFAMLASFGGSAALAPQSAAFAALLLAQAGAYAAAALRLALPSSPALRRLDPIAYLVAGHAAGLAGSIRYLAGRDRTAWRRAASPAATFAIRA